MNKYNNLFDFIKQNYEELETIENIQLVEETPRFANDRNLQIVDDEKEHPLLENFEYVNQWVEFAPDDYHGNIARKIKGKNKWITWDYTC